MRLSTRGDVLLLFSDLANYRELATASYESAQEALRTHFKLVEAASWRACCNSPRTHGEGLLLILDNPEAALNCAVKLQQSIGRHNFGAPNQPLSARVAIHSGPQPRKEQDYLAQAVAYLRHLCEAADSRQIVISETVRQELRIPCEYSLRELPLPTRGRFGETEKAWLIDWSSKQVSSVPLPMSLSVTEPVPFVGRKAELEQLTVHWNMVQGGERRVTLLVGDTGVGKSRLIAEFGRRAHAEGAVVLAGRCDTEGITPYQPFTEALTQFVAAADDQDLRARLRNAGAELTALVPELLDRFPDLAGATAGAADLERHRLFEAVATMLGGSEDERPVVLFLEDLHWADAPTLVLLRYLIRRPVRWPIFLVGTYRDNELGRSALPAPLIDLRRETGVEFLTLSGLAEEEVAAFLAEWLGPASSQALVRVLHKATQGRPLFLEEVVRHLADLGAFEVPGGWARLFDEYGVPESVREVVGRRLSLMSPRAQAMLRVASVIGTEFDITLLESVSELSRGELWGLLEEAIAGGVINEVGAKPGRCLFSHALVREVLYDSLPVFRRKAIHLATASFLEQYEADKSLPELAYHMFSARPLADASRTVAYGQAAGDQAMLRLAYEEAARQFDRALELLREASPTDEQARCELLLKLSDARQNAGDFPAAREAARAALPIARSAGADLLGRVALSFAGPYGKPGTSNDEVVEVLEEALKVFGHEETSLKAKLITRLGTELHPQTTWQRSQSLLQEGVEVARRVADADAILFCESYQLYLGAPMPDRLLRTEHFLRLATEHVAKGGRGAHAVLWGHNQRARAFLEVGDILAVKWELDAYANASTKLRVPFHSAFTTLWEAMLALMEGRFVHAEELIDRASYLCQLAGLPDAALNHSAQLLALQWERGLSDGVLRSLEALSSALPDLPSLSCALAAAYADFDRRNEARAQFIGLVARPSLSKLPRDANWLSNLAMLAETCAYLNDTRSAKVLYELLLPWSDRMAVVGNAVLCYGPIARPLGLIATTLRRFDEARDHFERALESASVMQARPSTARAKRDYASMLLARGDYGDQEHASHLIAEARRAASSLGMSRLCEQLELLEGNARRRPLPLARRGALTQRELEVLSLIARGLPNKKIAREIGVAEKTVRTHVSNILAKLDVHDRTQAAVYAVRNGLTDFDTNRDDLGQITETS